MEGQLGARYDIKSEFVGPDAHHQQNIRALNRSIRWTQRGLEYEPDQRHAELIIRDMGMGKSHPTPTRGIAATKAEEQPYEQSPQLNCNDATAFRGLAARLNYLALDRPELQFAAKQTSKRMAQPREAPG